MGVGDVEASQPGEPHRLDRATTRRAYRASGAEPAVLGFGDHANSQPGFHGIKFGDQSAAQSLGGNPRLPPAAGRNVQSYAGTSSYKALWNFVHQTDPEAFAARLNRCLAAHVGKLPRALAIAGKWVRDRTLSLCLSEHESVAPVAVSFAKVGDGEPEAKCEGEQSMAKRLYEMLELENVAVTGDALSCDCPGGS